MAEPGAAAPLGDLGDLGVVVVTYDAADVIAGCLESLMAARGAWAAATGRRLRVAVVDNASTDGTLAVIRDWAAGHAPYAAPADLPFALPAVDKPVALAEGGSGSGSGAGDAAAADVTLLRSKVNRGFAGGVNVGLAHFAADPDVSHFWVLNPDAMTPDAALAALGAYLAGGAAAGLTGGRVSYLERPDTIQIDGGTLNRWTGVTGNYNLRRQADTKPPDPAELDFITGASLVASRAFYEAVGPMREDYFLYYEEVDWALRRGGFALGYAAGFDVYHWGGTAIGSPVVGRAASPFSLYFKHRARIRFQSRFHPWALPAAWAYSLVQALREGTARRSPQGAWAILAASFGLRPPAALRARIGPEAATHAFAPHRTAGRPAAARRI